jgi:hypothetical protein
MHIRYSMCHAISHAQPRCAMTGTIPLAMCHATSHAQPCHQSCPAAVVHAMHIRSVSCHQSCPVAKSSPIATSHPQPLCAMPPVMHSLYVPCHQSCTAALCHATSSVWSLKGAPLPPVMPGRYVPCHKSCPAAMCQAHACTASMCHDTSHAQPQSAMPPVTPSHYVPVQPGMHSRSCPSIMCHATSHGQPLHTNHQPPPPAQPLTTANIHTNNQSTTTMNQVTSQAQPLRAMPHITMHSHYVPGAIPHMIMHSRSATPPIMRSCYVSLPCHATSHAQPLNATTHITMQLCTALQNVTCHPVEVPQSSHTHQSCTAAVQFNVLASCTATAV